jgi:hypothetical protein
MALTCGFPCSRSKRSLPAALAFAGMALTCMGASFFGSWVCARPTSFLKYLSHFSGQGGMRLYASPRLYSPSQQKSSNALGEAKIDEEGR